ncbi:MAG: YncE family protein [Acidimicrobiales bacterium]
MARHRVPAVVGVALVAGALVAGAAACSSPAPAARTDVPEPASAPAPAAAPAGTVVSLGGDPEGVVADPATGLVAIGVRSPDGVLVVDHEGRLVRRIGLSSAPRHLEPGLTSGSVLAPVEGTDRLEVVDLRAGTVVSTTAVGRQPHDAAAAAGTLFAGNELADSLSVISGGSVTATLPMPRQPGGVATNGRTVAVVGVRGRRMAVVEAATAAAVGTVACGVGPTHVVAGPDGRYYVADTQGGRVLVYEDSPQLRQTGSAAAAGAPYGITVDPGRRHLWATLTARNQVVEYDISGRLPRRLATFATVRQPNSVAVDPTTGLVFVSGATAAGDLQILRPAR